ncbi:MAG: hypothetical protein ACTSRP_01585 [Candidatus Helarchaeota archaeon]
MVQSDIKIEGRKLLEEHHSLFKELIKIPDKREVIYREEIKPIGKIGKPRFKNPKYKWEKNLLVRLRNHLQNIWNFFEKYSFWFDDTIIPLLHTDKRRVSKKSIIFLLENDVWNTDEIYGDYLIEIKENNTIISYYRRNRKIREFRLKTMNDLQIQEWICRDAVRQIKKQFKYLWRKLESEIDVCINEFYYREPKLRVSSKYLIDQLKKANDIVDQWPEAALFSLGRILELWLLINLDERNSQFNDLIRRAEINGIIGKNERKFLERIRVNYNDLKHNLYYKVKVDTIKNLIRGFNEFFSIKNKLKSS